MASRSNSAARARTASSGLGCSGGETSGAAASVCFCAMGFPSVARTTYVPTPTTSTVPTTIHATTILTLLIDIALIPPSARATAEDVAALVADVLAATNH